MRTLRPCRLADCALVGLHVRRGDMLHMLHDSPDGFWAHAAERPAAEEQP